MDPEPIEGQILLLTAAKASVGPQRIPSLVDRVQRDLAPRLETLRRRYELAYESPERVVFFVEPDYWEAVADRLGLGRREVDAVERAHAEQLRRIGRRTGRSSEFESAMEIRSCVVVAPDE